MRLSKYTKTPIDFFLGLSMGEFYEWVKTMNKEIDMERRMQKRAMAEAKAKRR